MVQTMKPDKQPWETFPISMGFSENMEDGETINAANSSVVVIDTATGDNVSETLLEGSPTVVAGKKLQAQLKGGTHGKKYKISFRAYISVTKQLEEDLIFDVRD